jgi:hypothetical protein
MSMCEVPACWQCIRQLQVGLQAQPDKSVLGLSPEYQAAA